MDIYGVNKNINFFVLVRGEMPGAGARKGLISVAICAAALVIMLGLWLLFTLLKINIDNKEEMLLIVGTDEALIDVNFDSFTDVAAILEEGKMPLANAFNAIFASQPIDLQVSSISYSKHVMTLDCKSKRELCGADFAAYLRETKEFSKVEYNGVARLGGEYGFTLTLTLFGKGAGPNEPDEAE